MDMSHFSIPRPEPPKLRGTAEDLINGINAQMAWLRHSRKADEFIRIYYGGAFGMLRVIRISAEGTDFLRIGVTAEDGSVHFIVAPVSQCSFMLSFVKPTADEPEEKVIFGFAEPPKT